MEDAAGRSAVHCGREDAAGRSAVHRGREDAAGRSAEHRGREDAGGTVLRMGDNCPTHSGRLQPRAAATRRCCNHALLQPCATCILASAVPSKGAGWSAVLNKGEGWSAVLNKGAGWSAVLNKREGWSVVLNKGAGQEGGRHRAHP
ncbi:hypothetical protein CLOM_g14346 [Closterium sp. NIES-68]|nr:hypothetical protein CLOM_g14346 [Closterium sp. NIES-68]GJP61667.1 hypothetical protein CLOP_g18817 [Closterium sp. NIES-67]